jgi:hypothetical protein
VVKKVVTCYGRGRPKDFRSDHLRADESQRDPGRPQGRPSHEELAMLFDVTQQLRPAIRHAND